MAARTEDDRLPFEPGKKRRKQSSNPKQQATASRTSSKRESAPSSSGESGGIPEVVSRRMIARIAFFCGLPTLLGLATFVVSYFIIRNDWFELPHVVVLIVSLGWFGLGVLGVSYGALSASWEETTPGSLLGWSEFSTNLGRTVQAWRASKRAKMDMADD